MYEIYLHINTRNNKIYVGCTTIGWDRRWNYWYYQAIKRYGEEEIGDKKEWGHRLLDVCDDIETASEREEYWIKKYDSTNPNKGYNIQKGGGGSLGTNHSKTEEHKRKISEANKGKHAMSEEHKSAVSTGMKKYWDEHPERRAKPKEKKDIRVKVDVYKKDGEFIGTFDSLREVSQAYAIPHCHLSDVINGKRKSAHGLIVVRTGEPFRPFEDMRGKGDWVRPGRPKKNS